MLVRRRTTLVALLLTLMFGVVSAPVSVASPSGDITELLARVPGLTVVAERPSPDPAYRVFALEYKQFVDQRAPARGTFQQRLLLTHRSVDAPMVLYTTGYFLPAQGTLSEPARVLGTNQLAVEERFFGPSTPNPADWSTLDVRQAATDHHRIVQAFAPLYRAAWLSTGTSKGGMASVYHRRFYPDDVVGVVAYSASDNTIDSEDSAYDRFFATVGTESCRAALRDFQVEALTRRDQLDVLLDQDSARTGRTFTRMFGSTDRALEMAVLDTPWAFWQFSPETKCAQVPPRTASTDTLYAFIKNTAPFESYSDQELLPLAPFFYQAATQTGWPSPRFAHLWGLPRYPGVYEANSSLPPELRRDHQAWPMIDVDLWVRFQSSRMLFVYGGNDPWAAEPFTPSGRDSYRYVVAGTNHLVTIDAMKPADRTATISTIRRWAGY